MKVDVKSDPVDVRDLAPLLAAGAFDALAKALPISLTDYSELELRIRYTIGGAGGSARYMIFVSDSETGVYYPRAVDQNTLTIATPLATSDLFQSVKLLPVGTLDIAIPQIPIATAKWMKILFAEVGAVATPGTLEATCILGGSQLA